MLILSSLGASSSSSNPFMYIDIQLNADQFDGKSNEGG